MVKKIIIFHMIENVQEMLTLIGGLYQTTFDTSFINRSFLILLLVQVFDFF